jgi:PEP-CTERM motif-containing protein
LTINTGTSLFSGSADLSSGDATLKVAIPEPGTLVLFGTGLMGLAGILRNRGMRR